MERKQPKKSGNSTKEMNFKAQLWDVQATVAKKK
jgi:hypothetical protein